MGPDLLRPRSLRLSLLTTWTPPQCPRAWGQAFRFTPYRGRRHIPINIHTHTHRLTKRPFSTTPSVHSGHNRWSKIKHDKAKTDARTSKLRTQLSSDIIIAVRLHGPNPTFNSRLSAAIAAAKKGQLSKSSIEHAILRGQGKSPSGLPLEPLLIEAMLPHGVAALIECQTDNKARTLQDIRLIVSKAGGTVTPTSFLFEKKGRIVFEEQSAIGVDEALEEAIEAGASDISMDGADNKLVVETPPDAVMDVAQRLQDKFGLRLDKAEVVYDPNEDSLVKLTAEQGEEVGKVLDALEEDPALQNLYVNATSQ